MIFCFLVILGGYFLGNFWVFQIFETVFEMTIYDFGGVYLLKLIHLRPYYTCYKGVTEIERKIERNIWITEPPHPTDGGS